MKKYSDDQVYNLMQTFFAHLLKARMLEQHKVLEKGMLYISTKSTKVRHFNTHGHHGFKLNAHKNISCKIECKTSKLKSAFDTIQYHLFAIIHIFTS